MSEKNFVTNFSFGKVIIWPNTTTAVTANAAITNSLFHYFTNSLIKS